VTWVLYVWITGVMRVFNTVPFSHGKTGKLIEKFAIVLPKINLF
jgi:hypothetical protein